MFIKHSLTQSYLYRCNCCKENIKIWISREHNTKVDIINIQNNFIVS